MSNIVSSRYNLRRGGRPQGPPPTVSHNENNPSRSSSGDERPPTLVPADYLYSEVVAGQKRTADPLLHTYGNRENFQPVRKDGEVCDSGSEHHSNSDVSGSNGGNDDFRPWTLVTRHRAHSLDSNNNVNKIDLRKFQCAHPRTSQKTGAPLSAEQTSVIQKAEKNLSKEDRQKIQKRMNLVNSADATNISDITSATTDIDFRGEGPSNKKGKAVDPRNWGAAGLSDEELDINAQCRALEAYKNLNTSGKPVVLDPEVDSDLDVVKQREALRKHTKTQKKHDRRKRRRVVSTSESDVTSVPTTRRIIMKPYVKKYPRPTVEEIPDEEDPRGYYRRSSHNSESSDDYLPPKQSGRKVNYHKRNSKKNSKVRRYEREGSEAMTDQVESHIRDLVDQRPRRARIVHSKPTNTIDRIVRPNELLAPTNHLAKLLTPSKNKRSYTGRQKKHKAHPGGSPSSSSSSSSDSDSSESSHSNSSDSGSDSDDSSKSSLSTNESSNLSNSSVP
ncbi:hypothetical protein K435DRAFT_855849 [Dendrothele bispora CBS 962.96]|uniref:Uncharacterized protein n=1 Tax=Dendrothele bispora (strain CBS 962.96) TaxID=1314807 RepID=A0A4S8MA51_DENBC|nr:hypothetical protein K435DRAFT_855849 [Dendrothele bispora CBS 962.96]